MYLVPLTAITVFCLLAYRILTDLRLEVDTSRGDIDIARRIAGERLDRGEIDRADLDRIVALMTS